VADLGFEKGCFLYGGQSLPCRKAAHPGGVWGHVPPEIFLKNECTEVHFGTFWKSFRSTSRYILVFPGKLNQRDNPSVYQCRTQ